ncbi:hypothetical protein Rhopal_002958-T1 [Rhodotorula paludigena]|uniref:Amino acid transporter n=1 Tax=Rhodotorula paludigena TaxID=86838 RepID=A0AAV5GJA3_9BASI|nr:hypothetical protein Rhopal_002958-T1 [Rhodotorula paludigena]
MVSIWPTAEGQIAWTEHLAPPSCSRFLSIGTSRFHTDDIVCQRYYVAWLTAIAWIFMTSSATFICAVSITGIASLCHPTYVPERWHTALMFWAILIIGLFLNIYGMRLFSHLNNVVAFSMLGSTVTIVAILFAKSSGDYNSAHYAFLGFENGTGWSSRGITFIVGMVSAAFSILGYDSVAHMCEEMYKPAVYAPRAMVGSVLISLPAGLLIILAFVFTIKDIPTIATQIFPLTYILEQALGNKAGAAFLTVTMSTTSAACASMSMLATSGRVIWSFALEGGIPFSRQLSKINRQHHVPIRAMVVSVIIQCLIVLIYIGNAALFNSILVLAIALLNASYLIPNFLMLTRGRRSGTLPKAPFSLGPVLGPVCNVVAIIYELFISVMLFLPTVRPVTGENMNYACAIFGVAHIVCGVYWFFGGRKRAHNYATDRAAAVAAAASNDTGSVKGAAA